MRTILHIILLLLTLACLPACHKPSGSASSAADTNLICLGNSLTAGYGASIAGEDDKNQAYPAFLQDSVNLPVINAGVSGDKTADALQRLPSDVLAKRPRIVIIELGANDLFNQVPIATTKANLQAIIDQIKHDNRKIFLTKFYTEEVARSIITNSDIMNSPLSPFITDELIAAYIKNYDDMFASLAADNGITLIENIWTGVWGINMSDAIHPNAAGYKIMAHNYLAIIKPYLRENNLLKIISRK